MFHDIVTQKKSFISYQLVQSVISVLVVFVGIY
jgi:hypothetical protein